MLYANKVVQIRISRRARPKKSVCENNGTILVRQKWKIIFILLFISIFQTKQILQPFVQQSSLVQQLCQVRCTHEVIRGSGGVRPQTQLPGRVSTLSPLPSTVHGSNRRACQSPAHRPRPRQGSSWRGGPPRLHENGQGSFNLWFLPPAVWKNPPPQRPSQGVPWQRLCRV